MADMANINHQFAPPAPGEVLKQTLLAQTHLTQRQLARALGVSEPRLTMMFKGRCRVSAEIALRVERAFGISPQFWMRVRDEYELYHERRRLSAILAELPKVQDPATVEATPWTDDLLAAA